MAAVTLLELVRNWTMDEHVAALLWTIAEEKRSLVTAAVPRKAGKTTVLEAALQFAPRGTPIHEMDGTLEQIEQLGHKPDGGYLIVGEISEEPPVRYIWGDEVRALFKSLRAGFSLATTMHATGADDVFHQICKGNEISDEDASKIQYVVYVERFGESDDSYWRRVAGVYEIEGVSNGRPAARLLHRLRAKDGRLERVGAPHLLSASKSALTERAAAIRRLVDSGRTSSEEVRKLTGAATGRPRTRAPGGT